MSEDSSNYQTRRKLQAKNLTTVLMVLAVGFLTGCVQAQGTGATAKQQSTKANRANVSAQANQDRGESVAFTVALDTGRPVVRMVTPFVSTKISKKTTYKVKWSVEDPGTSAGLKYARVYYRPSGSPTWHLWKVTAGSGEALFTGRAGVTYSWRTLAVDNARNWKWSKIYKTTVPFNEGIYYDKTGFLGYEKLSRSQNYLSSVRYSFRRGHTLRYKLYNTNGIGLVVTKGPKMGRAKIYVDGKYVAMVDAHNSTEKARQLIYYKGFSSKKTHWLKVVNLGTSGRAKFEVDAVVVKR